MKPKKLSEYLATVDENEIVCIGSKEGSSFLYIGPAGEALEKCKIHYEEYREKREAKLEENRKVLRGIFHRISEMEDPDIDNDDLVRDLGKNIAKVTTQIINDEEYLKGYTPVEGRYIVNKPFQRIPTDTAIVIEVSGKENGKFWFKKEYDQYYNK